MEQELEVEYEAKKPRNNDNRSDYDAQEDSIAS